MGVPRFRPMPRFSSQLLAARLGEREPGSDAFLDQLALELCDAGGRMLGEYGASATAPYAETIWMSPAVAR